MAQYVLDNAARETEGRFAALASTYDPVTFDALSHTGVRDGWRCLEVGGGGGSVADWLSREVGHDGSVVVTDIDPQWMVEVERRSNVHVLRHDVVDDPLPEGEFDLVHARLLLLHLPARERVLRRLAGCLRPGGWLVIEDFDCDWCPVLSAPDPASAELFALVHRTMLGLLRQGGADLRWGRRIHGVMAACGLRVVSTTTYARAWPGGSAGIDLHRVNAHQLARRLLVAGIRQDQLDAFDALLADPAFVVNSSPMITTVGRR
jgi:SAM-dependent methyltransferase